MAGTVLFYSTEENYEDTAITILCMMAGTLKMKSDNKDRENNESEKKQSKGWPLSKIRNPDPVEIRGSGSFEYVKGFLFFRFRSRCRRELFLCFHAVSAGRAV